jgi:hypothetical protein
MAHAVEDEEPGSRDRAGRGSTAAHIDEWIVGPVHYERRDGDGLQRFGPVSGGGDGRELPGDTDRIMGTVVGESGSPA